MADKMTLFGFREAGAAMDRLTARHRARLVKSLKLAAELTDRKVTLHLDNQDLPWDPLSPQFLALKERKGFSTDIYTMTSAYRQAIATKVDATRLISFVGVLRPVPHKKPDGKGGATINMVQLGYVLEYGSIAASIPARPLWRPTFEEMKPVVRRLFGDIVGQVVTG